MSNQSKKFHDYLDRSKKGSNPLPRLFFSMVRAIDPYIQYLIVVPGYGRQIISKTGIVTINPGQKGLLLVVMTAACTIKQIFHMTCILEEQISYPMILTIGIFDIITHSLATLSSFIYGPSNGLGTLQYVGISFFTVGILTELISELQRKRFKNNPVNKGKVYSGGLFSLARHINYGGFTLWRTGLVLTSGNYWLAALLFSLHTWDFTTRAIPCMTDYCSKKYGEDWKKFENDVPYTLFPYIY
ncbi:unnamed protein product [Rotaria magnacalcarata]|uniref:Steroid 5-alpha reductase C-terminal domain-containing protein n=5 Tax=Rotaria magnacalcarata TaxID=392030 RepID=A0A816N4C6_9BILA|nr:unnamed protein product [Rotaria magnacalcarata]CAF2030891.1 unnamed protein product [Rotaria magnacalcarata]CAF2033427.1 unnamed protein product [Rotaria magnacalcarata]CAF2096005.1 unnamed protein product [Rotaria magnacalcarata]CAF3893282.1 unnamed protein product [Rotaria magnacalcarata]